MTDFLIKTFVRNYEKVDNKNVRQSYGVFGSIVGIISNILLFVIKLIIGLLLKSIAITADSINNLTDAGSSIVSLIGFKMASKPADKEHPFGHGRMEYISGLIVSIIVLVLGLDFFKSSIVKVFNPEEINFSIISMVILFLTVLIKIWQSSFNKKIGLKIDSVALLATAQDSMNDVYVTSATIITTLIAHYSKFNIDGIAGVMVSGFLVYSGIELLKETISPILGEAVSTEITNEIKEKIKSYDGILGVHDLIIHDYGPNQRMTTIHVELPENLDLKEAHLLIDDIERDVEEEMDISLLIHIDPVSTKNPVINEIRERVFSILSTYEELIKAHDFRLINSKGHKAISFDLYIPFSFLDKNLSVLVKQLEHEIKEVNEEYEIIIDIRKKFTQEK